MIGPSIIDWVRSWSFLIYGDNNNDTLFPEQCHGHAVHMIMKATIAAKQEKIGSHVKTVGGLYNS